MEVLLDNVCVLCEEVTAVLTPQCVAPYIKYLYSTFFDKNKDAMQKLQINISDGGMCALCSHQVVIAHKFKDSYEDICKKNGDYKKNRTGCFLCEQKGVDLISTDSDPNKFSMKISTFMDTSVFPTPYVQCMVCFDCIFYLNVWYKMFSYIQNKCNTQLTETTPEVGTSPSTRTKAQKKVHFNEADTVIEINGPDENTANKQRKKSPPPKMKPPRKSKPGPLSAKKNIGLKKSKASFKNLLKNQLKHLKSIKQTNRRKKWSPDIVKNHKIYLEVPYVLLSRDQIRKFHSSNKEREGSKSPDLIEIFDSDDEDKIKQNKPSAVKKNFSFKIKMSHKFLAGPKTAKRKQKNVHVDYTCEVCDKILVSLAEYKMHALWHDKPERPFVNVTRSHFSASENQTEADKEKEDSLNNDSKDLKDQETEKTETNEGVCDDKIESAGSDHETVDDKSGNTGTEQDKIHEENTENANTDISGEKDESNIKDAEETDKTNTEEKENENKIEETSEEKEDKNNMDGDASETNKELRKDVEDDEEMQTDKSHLEEKDNSYVVDTEETNENKTDKDNSGEIDQSNVVDTEETNETKTDKDNSEEIDESNVVDTEETNETKTDKENSKEIDESNVVDTEETNEKELDKGNSEESKVVNTEETNEEETDKGNSEDNVNNIVDAEETNNGEEEQIKLSYDNKNECESRDLPEQTEETASLEHNSKSNEFSSDSENNDPILENSLAELVKDNGEVEGETVQEQLDTSTQNANHAEDLINNKKRNHDGNINEDGVGIFQNGNDDIFQSKRIKFTDNEAEIIRQEFIDDMERQEENLET